MNHVILSSPILVENGKFQRVILTRSEAQRWAAENDPKNYSAHQTTKVLGVEPAQSRETVTGYDEALIISPKGRLEFGREYSLEEIEAVGVSFVLISKI